VNFLSTYSEKKSCHTSTTLQTSIARFVSDSLASCFFYLPWRRPCGNHEKRCMNEKTIISACQTPRSMYTSVSNLSQLFEPQEAQLSQRGRECLVLLSTLVREFVLTNCLAAYAHLTITVSEIERDIDRKSSCFHTPLAFDVPVRGGGFPSEYHHPVWY